MDHAITTTAPDGTIGVTGGADPAGAGTEGGSSSTTWNPLPLIREIAAQTCSLVTPRHCPCGEEGTWLCRRCAGLLAAPAIRVESCCDALQHLTAARVHAEQHGGVLLPAGVDHTPILPVLALGEYSGPLQRLVLAWKNGGMLHLGAPLARALAPVIARLAADAEQTCPALVPVPSRLGARLRRGEDHTAELVRELARTGAGRPLLLRSTPTTAQEGQGSRQRRTRQIRLAGHAARRAGQERSAVIIVDDVVTTGSTLRGMHEALTGAGMTVLGAAVVASARLPVREQGEIF
ncbi:MAG: ComF family protein [Brachybacterium tyrofermentans]|uniref:ComF family protein n=1 Tax=Brachybacterium tyrofermentans TaxID=47848 RepID=A0ABW0FBT4_9MICO|nr:phosphoribosyltransferase family protein [Brachybacterium tyrofermentans]SLN02572.1 Competence protein F homolog, phosphoribosyltransferase domain; protein YhgH required for utilization of DNA as sole source of carbon and energy [Corynebacterium xerosis]